MDDFELLSWGFEGVVLSRDFWTHPIMQELRGKKQLGPLEGNNPGATHSRYDHSGMATRLVVKSFEVLQRFGSYDKGLNNIAAATALHDVGHPPFSHPTEKLFEAITGLDHKKYGLQLFESDRRDAHGQTLQDTLRGVGIKSVKAMLAGSDPGMKLCSDQTLGADKLAYLLLDAKQVRFSQLPPNPWSIVKFLAVIDDVLGVDVGRKYSELENPLSNVEAAQNFQMRMYTDVYFSPRTAAFDRAVQKAVDLAIRAKMFAEPDDASDNAAAMRMWPLADEVLVDRIMNGNGNPNYDRGIARKARETLDSYRLRKPYVPVVAFKYAPFVLDRLLGEHVAVIDEESYKGFQSKYKDPRDITDNIEAELENRYGVPFMVTSIRKPERLSPDPVSIFYNGKLEGTLEDIRPAHYANLREIARSAAVIRLNVSFDDAGAMSHQAKKIEADFRSIIKERLAH